MKSSFLFIALMALLFTACQPNLLDDPTGQEVQYPSTTYYKGDPSCSESFTLYAGQTIPVGDIVVSNDNDSIYVTYTLTGGWELVESHLYIGNVAGIPSNKSGNPKIGNFPYQRSHTAGTTTYSYSVVIPGNESCYVIAAHASVQLVQAGSIVQSETAWSEGTRMTQKGNWATYSDYCLMDCCQISTIQYTMYGGQTINVGTLDVTNDGVNLFITYNFTGGWSASQTHLYVGALSGLPTNNANTPVPGQFPYNDTHSPNVSSYTYVIPLAGLDPCYIIAAHASAVNSTNGGSETTWSEGVKFPNTNRWGWYSEYCTQSCD